MSAAGASGDTMADAIKTETILLVGIVAADGLSLDQIFLDSNWQSHGVGNCREALGFLDQHHVSVVLTEPELADGSWRELLNGMARHSAPPNLVVSSRLADDRLWAEVLNLGGYDLLVTPFEAEEVRRVTFAARHDWGCKQLEGRARAARAGSTASQLGDRQMFNTRPARTAEFKEGDPVVLAEGAYQGTLGVFIRLRPDVNWAEIRERSGAMRCHPVAWLQHSDPPGNTGS
jgi:DNA-binding NtrC family response regulator